MQNSQSLKRHVEDDNDDDNDGESELDIAKSSKLLKSRVSNKRLVVVLENANIEVIKIGKTFELLNCEDHKSYLSKCKRDTADCRPDIAHQCLMMLMDSPLNRAGLLRVYIHTSKSALIEINPQTRIPRTMKRFSGIMVQLLYKLSIRSADGAKKLLRLIKNPVIDHLPVGCRKVVTSYHASKLVRAEDLVPEGDVPVVVVVGAMAHGQVEVDYTNDTVSISQYPLSAALTCTKVCTAFENAWGIH